MENKISIVELALKPRGLASKVARTVGVSRQSVDHWKTRGVPSDHAKIFVEVTGCNFRPSDLVLPRYLDETEAG